MRIAQMLDTLHMGGAQKMQIFLVQSLVPLGIEVTVISLDDSPNDSVVAELKKAGARIVTFPFPRMIYLPSFWRLVNFLRDEKFVLVHSYLTYSNIIGSIAGMLSGTPVITSLRNSNYERKVVTNGRILLENIVLRYFAQRVTSNGYSVSEFGRRRLGNKPIDIIVNSVELITPLPERQREELRRELTGDAKRPIVLTAGRLVAQKGFRDLLEAFRIVVSKKPGSTLVIAGKGDLENELRSLVGNLGLESDVFFLGFRDDIRHLMSAADVYVNSSHWEGTPVSVLEAMAAGLPIVATDVGDNQYLLEDGCGLLVPPHAPECLADTIDILLSSPSRRNSLGAAARDRVRNNYGRAAWCKKLLTLYSQVATPAESFLNQVEQSEAFDNQ